MFYGWFVVAASFAALTLSFGAIYAFGAFFTPLAQEFNANRAAVAGLFSVAVALATCLGAVSGRIEDRTGPRPLMLAGGLLVGGGLLLAGRAGSFWQVYAGYGVGVGLGAACILVPTLGAVQRWFVRRRGLASGLAVAGIGAGNLAGPPLAAWLIRRQGWQVAFTVLGVAALAGLVGAALLMQPSPEARGLRPDGDPPADPDRLAPSSAAGATAGEAVRSRTFWLLYAAVVVSSLAVFIPFAHLVPDAEAHGVSPVKAAWLLGLIGAGSLGGRLVLGSSADRIGRRRSLILALALMLAAMLFWLVADRTWSLALFAVVFGIAYGSYAALLPALAADYFGVAHAGAIIGLLYTALGPGSLIGPPLAGWIFELRDSYTVPILAGAAAIAVALALVLALPAPGQTTPHVHRG